MFPYLYWGVSPPVRRCFPTCTKMFPHLYGDVSSPVHRCFPTCTEMFPHLYWDVSPPVRRCFPTCTEMFLSAERLLTLQSTPPISTRTSCGSPEPTEDRRFSISWQVRCVYINYLVPLCIPAFIWLEFHFHFLFLFSFLLSILLKLFPNGRENISYRHWRKVQCTLAVQATHPLYLY